MTPGLEGAQACYSGGSLTDCPYPVGSKECEQWTGRFEAARETWQCPWCRVHFHVDKLSEKRSRNAARYRCTEKRCNLTFREYSGDNIPKRFTGPYQMHTTTEDLRRAGRA